MRVEMGPRQFSVRVYEREGDEAYVASVQVFAYGDRAFLYSLQGARFYEATREITEQLDAQGFRSIEFYAGKAHARLLRRVLRDSPVWAVTVGAEGLLDGHRLSWVTIARRPACG